MAGLIAVGSFLLSLYLTQANQPWAFFSLPTRAWELGLGAFLAIGATQLARIPARPAAVLAWVGLAMVALSGVVLSTGTPFPGVAALLPTVGSALVIAGGFRQAPFAPGRWLSMAIPRFLGRISYSLYLWHWPLLILPGRGARHEAAVVGPRAPGPGFDRCCRGHPALGGGSAAPWPRDRHAAPPQPRHGGGAHGPRRDVLARHRRGHGQRARPGRRRATPPPTSSSSTRSSAGSRRPRRSPPFRPRARPRPPTRGRPRRPRPRLCPRAGPGPDAPVRPTCRPRRAARSPPACARPSARPGRTTRCPYQDGCHVKQEDTVSGPCEYADTSSSTTVVLMGDSHALSWFPAVNRLAIDRGWRLVNLTKSACASADFSQWNTEPQACLHRVQPVAGEHLPAHRGGAARAGPDREQPDVPGGRPRRHRPS